MTSLFVSVAYRGLGTRQALDDKRYFREEKNISMRSRLPENKAIFTEKKMSPPSKINHKRSLHTRGPVAGTGRRDWSPVEFTRWNESRGPVP